MIISQMYFLKTEERELEESMGRFPPWRQLGKDVELVLGWEDWLYESLLGTRGEGVGFTF